MTTQQTQTPRQHTTPLGDADVDEFTAHHERAIVYAHAAWCSLCRVLSAQYEELAAQYAGAIAFGSIDVDAAPEHATRQQIMSLPTLLMYRRGRLVGRIVGLVPRQRLVAELEALLHE